MENRELIFFSYIGKGNDPTRDIKMIQELNDVGCTYEVKNDTEVWVGLEVWLCSEKFMKAVKDVSSDSPKQTLYKFPLRTQDGSRVKLEVSRGTGVTLRFEKIVENQLTKSLDTFSGRANIEQIGVEGESIKFGYFTVKLKNRYVRIQDVEDLEQSLRERSEVTKWLGELIPGVSKEHIRW